MHTVAVGGGASALAVDERGGRVFVASTDAAGPTGSPIGTGSVSILNARDGAMLHSIGVAVTPSALAFDERRGVSSSPAAARPTQRAAAMCCCSLAGA